MTDIAKLHTDFGIFVLLILLIFNIQCYPKISLNKLK